jgi:motility quorum-sensing regulator/GCU-specific mRNA interferase toxin
VAANYTTPTYDLTTVKKNLNSVSKLRMTKSSRLDAVALGFDDQDIVDVIKSVQDTDFHKTMPSIKIPHAPNQDVYKVHWKSLYLYLKFQNLNGFLVVSFKRV